MACRCWMTRIRWTGGKKKPMREVGTEIEAVRESTSGQSTVGKIIHHYSTMSSVRTPLALSPGRLSSRKREKKRRCLVPYVVRLVQRVIIGCTVPTTLDVLEKSSTS